MPFGGRVVEPSFPTQCSEELLGGVLDHGLLWGRRPTMSSVHENDAFIAPPRG
jgi:hypothetical protein